jgi:hypothetical protein
VVSGPRSEALVTMAFLDSAEIQMKKAMIALAITACSGAWAGGGGALGGTAQSGGGTPIYASGTLTVTGTIESSIELTIAGVGGAEASGLNTNSATVGLGSISKYGTVPTSFTRTTSSTDYTITGEVSVMVNKANLTSTDYTLSAQLSSAPATGVTWKLASNTLNETSPTTLTSTGTWGSAVPFAWDLVIADSAAPGSIANDINFTAFAN